MKLCYKASVKIISYSNSSQAMKHSNVSSDLVLSPYVSLHIEQSIVFHAEDPRSSIAAAPRQVSLMQSQQQLPSLGESAVKLLFIIMEEGHTSGPEAQHLVHNEEELLSTSDFMEC
ncbi:hypothetical protein Dimus_026455 [Dionaea muscipula]